MSIGRVTFAVVTAGLLAGAAPTQAGGLDVRVGGAFPRADSTLFDDVQSLYTLGDPDRGVEASDWNGVTGGAEFSFDLARNVELGFHVDVYDRTLETSYRDYVDPAGFEIRQSLKLSVVPLGVTLRFGPNERSARIQPYAAVGGDIVFWKYEEFGEFADFRGDFEIFDDSFASEGATPGFHAAAGLRFALGDDFLIVAEGRYLHAKADMGDDFSGSRIDLSAVSATLGVRLRF